DSKAYIGRLATAMVARIEAQGTSLDIWQLAAAIRRALSERHVLIDAQNPVAAQLFARHGWNGAVRPGKADFLMVVDSNVGYNKVNPNIKEEINYTVDLSDPAAPMATLTVRHTNTVVSQDMCVQFDDLHTTYADWMRRCFYNYLRVLAPRGSRLA